MNEVLHFPDIYSEDAGINFRDSYIVVCKSTQGSRYFDPIYTVCKSDAVKQNVYFMAYHFLQHGGAWQQAEYAYKIVGPHTPLALDVEPYLSSHPTVLDAEQFIDEYRRLGGIIHITYLPRWYWWTIGSPILGGLAERRQWLWTSEYPVNGYSDNGPGWESYGGLPVAMWQYSDSINYGGISDVDFNAFKGTGKQVNLPGVLGEFKRLVTTGELTTE
jgi:GH25 family lysozyme M1 (1,4-beta-N-acetylmuramidase)